MGILITSEQLIDLLFQALLDEVSKSKVHDLTLAQPVSTKVDEVNGVASEVMDYGMIHSFRKKNSIWVLVKGTSRNMIGDPGYGNDILMIPSICHHSVGERRKYCSMCGAIKASTLFYNSVLFSKRDGSIGTNAHGRFGQYLNSFLEKEGLKYLDFSSKGKRVYKLEYVGVLKKKVLKIVNILESEF